MQRPTLLIAFIGATLAIACSGDKSESSPAPATSVPGPPLTTTTGGTGTDESPKGPRIDPRTGLKMTDGFEVVAATCATCHSGKLVAQNRGSRHDWDERLRWMQANHNLWELPAETRSQILDYLAKNYGIDDDAARHRRRRPLPDHLMPPTRRELVTRDTP